MDHTSQTQIAGWIKKFEQIRETFNNSPLAKQNGVALSIGNFAKLITGMNGDHTADQKKTAKLFTEWKIKETQISIGLAELYEKMTHEELIAAFLPELQAFVEKIGGGRMLGLNFQRRREHDMKKKSCEPLHLGWERRCTHG